MKKNTDLFRNSNAMRVLRFVMYYGDVLQTDMRDEFHRLGATQTNIMHTFARYFDRSHAYDAGGSTLHHVLTRADKVGNTYRVRWIGSVGASFEERVAGWLGRLDDRKLELAHGMCESEFCKVGGEADESWYDANIGASATGRPMTEEEHVANAWLRAVRAEIARRASLTVLPVVTAMSVGFVVRRAVRRRRARLFASGPSELMRGVAA